MLALVMFGVLTVLPSQGSFVCLARPGLPRSVGVGPVLGESPCTSAFEDLILSCRDEELTDLKSILDSFSDAFSFFPHATQMVAGGACLRRNLGRSFHTCKTNEEPQRVGPWLGPDLGEGKMVSGARWISFFVVGGCVFLPAIVASR